MKLFTFECRFGTFGELYGEDGTKLCDTLERTWDDNAPFTSCIKRGTYELIPHKSPKFGQTYALKNEALGVGLNRGDAKRYGILFHPANKQSQLQGCIAPGQFGYLGKEWAVTHSRKSFEQLMDYIAMSGDRILSIYSQSGKR